MDNNLKLLLRLLSSGNFLSEKYLSDTLNLSKPAVYKIIKKLNEYGVELESNTHLGYRIPGGLELLDKKIITKHIDNKYGSFYDNVIIFDEISSTNSYLLDIVKDKYKKNLNPKKPSTICLSEFQLNGHGRLGRKWYSPYGKNIYLSIHWNLEKKYCISILSLVIAIGVHEALKHYGVKEEIFLKWPNDIVWKNRKLSGILIETCSDIDSVVIGIGLNVSTSENFSQNWCSLSQIISDIPQRNRLVGILINTIFDQLNIFQKEGVGVFINKWKNLDISYGKTITVITPEGKNISGIGYGIDNNGKFLLKDNNIIHSFAVGEISLKKLYNA